MDLLYTRDRYLCDDLLPRIIPYQNRILLAGVGLFDEVP